MQPRITITPKSLEEARSRIAAMSNGFASPPCDWAGPGSAPAIVTLPVVAVAALVRDQLRSFADPNVAYFADQDRLARTQSWANRLYEMLLAEHGQALAKHDALVDEDGVYQGTSDEQSPDEQSPEELAAYVRDNVDHRLPSDPAEDDRITAWESRRLNDAIRQQRPELVPDRFRDSLPVDEAMRHEALRQKAKTDPRRPGRTHWYSQADLVRRSGYTRGTVNNWLNLPSHSRPLLPASVKMEGLRRYVRVLNSDLFDWAYVYHPTLIEKFWGALKTK